MERSKILALQSIGSIMHEFVVVNIMRLPVDSFTRVWDTFVKYIQDAVLFDHRSVSTPALRCLEKAVKASSSAGFDLKPRVSEASERVWESCDHIGDGFLQKNPPMSPVSHGEDSDRASQPFTQESLMAFVDVIRCTRELCRVLEGVEWYLDRLTCLVGILKGETCFGLFTTPIHVVSRRLDLSQLTRLQTGRRCVDSRSGTLCDSDNGTIEQIVTAVNCLGYTCGSGSIGAWLPVPCHQRPRGMHYTPVPGSF